MLTADDPLAAMSARPKKSSTLPEPTPPRVLISYSHDNEAHANRTLALADRLRANGIDAMIDLYTQSPPEGWPAWCDAQIRQSKFVLMVCTETYLRRVNSEEQPGIGQGVLWEGRPIKQHLYNAGSASSKFVPVLFADGSDAHVPVPVAGATIHRVDTDEGYERLLRLLTDQPLTPMPPLGRRRILPARQRPLHKSHVTARETPHIATFESLCKCLSVIMAENKRIFKDFGPKSRATSDGVRFDLTLWYHFRLERIVPANAEMRRLISNNWDIIPTEHASIFRALLSHIDAFEAHVNDPNIDYRDHQFPAEIELIIARSGE